MDNIQLPIEHLSYSALSEYLSNRWLFKKHYILHDWNTESNPSWAVGKGFHKVMEMYYSGLSVEQAIAKGYEALEAEARNVNWADYKLVTLEKCKAQMAQAIRFYLEEELEVGTVLSTEKSMLTDFTIQGQKAPLPIKAVVDLITEKDEEIHLWDWKTTDRFTDLEEEQSNYILQAMFYYHAVKETYSRMPKVMHFVEVKKSENRDKSPQVQVYDIVYEKHPEYNVYFAKLFSGVIMELAGQVQFLPNLRDMMSSKETWQDFTAETMDFEMPKRVSHQSALTTNVDRTSFEKSFVSSRELDTVEEQIASKLLEFGVPVEFVEKHTGANVTMYTFKPSRGIKMSKVAGYEEDIMLATGAESVRVEAPIKGTKLVGIEVSNEKQLTIEWTESFLQPNTLNIPVGRNVYGEDIGIDLAKAPHLLVAGATGAGKSVFLNGVIESLTRQNDPEKMGLVLIDPKRTEFAPFSSLPHLESGIITEIRDVYLTLDWLAEEMEERYKTFERAGSRSIDEYNEKAGMMKKIVVVVDELADLMTSKEAMSNANNTSMSGEIERLLVRLAQKSRAAGIHLVLATQRPSVNVVTGILKANLPARVAFMTATEVDSRVILDQAGAERLLGNGDLLLVDPRERNMKRLQGYFLQS